MVPDEQSQPTQFLWPRELEDTPENRGLDRVVRRLMQTLERDRLVQDTLAEARQQLASDRVVLYYFFRQWRGRVTSEALADVNLSILGSTGPDDCFNDKYAALYLEGRVRAISDIATSEIDTCHKDFLEGLQVKANLVVPVRVNHQLWGLLIAHHCQCPRNWSDEDVAFLQNSAQQLCTAPSIRDFC